MKYLLDTHTMLWSIFSPGSISAKADKIITNPDNVIYVSAVSFWEISLKYNIGKLELRNYTPEDMPVLAEKSGFEVLNLTPEDASSFYRLPKEVHRDPFDRMLIWQAIRNKLTVVSKDSRFKEYESYGLKVSW